MIEIICFLQKMFTILLAFFLPIMGFKGYQIPTGSMAPTLNCAEYKNGIQVSESDKILVNCLSYTFSQPQRKDLVVFIFPNKDKKATRRDMVQRVIGLPNDKVSCKNGYISVNGVTMTEDYVAELTKNDFEETIVPPNSLFVMGDNRNCSADSRYWGFLPIENVIGEAVAIYSPIERQRILLQFPKIENPFILYMIRSILK